ncbi:hypothetical protein SAMN05216251_102490 [Actinacidiphila alni]|uniref:Uncharacterized protein n=1 Tax=Actinacidiphila alni TaxID=380248 RepID=A0A1I1ZKZ9_9ACTN|nr:hypothetical protein SAMN05216251_102490 [Actinacidiphila alni]
MRVGPALGHGPAQAQLRPPPPARARGAAGGEEEKGEKGQASLWTSRTDTFEVLATPRLTLGWSSAAMPL